MSALEVYVKLPLILEYVQSLGHAVFTNGLYNLNIIGVRSKSRERGAFDDWIVVVYRDESGWVARWWPATTDPGNPSGTAVLVPGQYRGAYQLGWHPNPNHERKYEALVQVGAAVTVYRDRDGDEQLDLDPATVETGWFGINIHMAGKQSASTVVGNWSAGCQVFSDPTDFHEFLLICKRQVEHHPTWTSFTYTLVDEPSL